MAAELEQLLDARSGGAAQRVGLDLVVVAEADDHGALIFVTQQNRAGGRAVEFRGRHAGGQGTSLDEKGDEIGRADWGGADVDFERGHLDTINKINRIGKALRWARQFAAVRRTD